MAVKIGTAPMNCTLCINKDCWPTLVGETDTYEQCLQQKDSHAEL